MLVALLLQADGVFSVVNRSLVFWGLAALVAVGAVVVLVAPVAK